MVAGGLLFYFSSFAAADAAETTTAAADAAAADALTTTAADAMTAAADANLTEKKGDGNVTQFFYIFFIFYYIKNGIFCCGSRISVFFLLWDKSPFFTQPVLFFSFILSFPFLMFCSPLLF